VLVQRTPSEAKAAYPSNWMQKLNSFGKSIWNSK